MGKRKLHGVPTEFYATIEFSCEKNPRSRDTELRLEDFIISIRGCHAVAPIKRIYSGKNRQKIHEIVHVRIY